MTQRKEHHRGAEDGAVFRSTHARTVEEIEALMHQIRTDADHGDGLTALWIRTTNGHAYVQIALGRCEEKRAARRTASSDADVVQQVRVALQSYRDLPTLEICALAGMLKTVIAARRLTDAAGDYPCAHALRALILRSIERIDLRPTRRSLTLHSVFEQICMLGLSQERSAENLHVEDRTIRRAMQELTAALVKDWIETDELEPSDQLDW